MSVNRWPIEKRQAFTFCTFAIYLCFQIYNPPKKRRCVHRRAPWTTLLLRKDCEPFSQYTIVFGVTVDNNPPFACLSGDISPQVSTHR